MPSRPSLGSRQVPDEYPFGPSQAVTTRSRQLEPTASRSMWRRKSRFPHGQVDTVPRGFLVVVDHMLDILARVDSEVSIAMPPVCERRLVVHAAVDAVDRCLELVANEPRAHSGSLTLEMAIGGRCDRRRELVAPAPADEHRDVIAVGVGRYPGERPCLEGRRVCLTEGIVGALLRVDGRHDDERRGVRGRFFVATRRFSTARSGVGSGFLDRLVHRRREITDGAVVLVGSGSRVRHEFDQATAGWALSGRVSSSSRVRLRRSRRWARRAGGGGRARATAGSGRRGPPLRRAA